MRCLPALALLGLACATLAAPGPELLTNGGFESTAPGGAPLGWTGFSTRDWGDCAGQARASSVTPHGGATCLELSGVREQYAAMAAPVPLAPGKTYLLSGWLRTELRRGQAAYLVAGWQTGKGWIANTNLRSLAGLTPWTKVEQVLSPSLRPEEATRVQVSFRVSGTSTAGRAWLDEVSLREIDPPPATVAGGGGDRLLDMARELLIERELWRERLRVLQARHSDLEQLLQSRARFAELQSRYAAAVRAQAFLTRVPRPRQELERKLALSSAADIRGQVADLGELPKLREQCFAELVATLQLKRRLDAAPDLRRFYLWAQLAAVRPEPQPAAAAAPGALAPELTGALAPELTGALAEKTGGNGDLLEAVVRTDPTDGTRGLVTAALTLAAAPAGTSVQAAVLSPGGRPVAFTKQAVSSATVALGLQVPRPGLWFPDCPYLYELHVVLLRDGRVVDRLRQKIAFRDLRVVESDVAPTLRHAWGWALADYTFSCNGQPYFPRGTVGGFTRAYAEQSAALCKELWLDFERTYGTAVARLSDEQADDLAARGLSLLGSLAPNYTEIRSYESAAAGLEEYRESVRRCRWLADHPTLLSLQVGNEAELATWGADLPGVYGKDLWHCFNEVVKVAREELQPAEPVGYVRAATFNTVLPVPREDYSGVNQYTGRYWGRRATISADLDELALSSARENKPVAITEWNGPKYSWATRGVSGVDEPGAAQYLLEYYRDMTRTPGLLLSTEFVLNWVVTPLEDLTSVPLAEGLKRRAAWHWNLQQGTPWFPSIWPDLLTDTPARRAMRGFSSPLFELCEAPGPIAVLAEPSARPSAAALAAGLQALGKQATAAALPAAATLAGQDTNLLILGGLGEAQPPAVKELQRLQVIGRTEAGCPPAGGYLCQRRVNPWFPDRALVVLTAADEAGMTRGLEALRASAAGLNEAYARQATCRRAVALVDDNEAVGKAFSRYVLELPGRSFLVGRDDLRTVLRGEDFLTARGTLSDQWSDLAALVVAPRRVLSAEEKAAVAALGRAGVTVIWSLAALEADPALPGQLGLALGATHKLTEHLPVADWAGQPLAVPELGDATLEPVGKYSGLKPDSAEWQRGTTARELTGGAEWRAAAAAGAPVVVSRTNGSAAEWAFGLDLQAVAVALEQTTQHGPQHTIYDRVTACGLERPFRLLANAMAGAVTPRPANLPRLRAQVQTDREVYAPGEPLTVRVQVRDAEGRPAEAAVRVTVPGPEYFLGNAGTQAQWVAATAVAPGLYEAKTALPALVNPSKEWARGKTRGMRTALVYADVARPGWVSDWTCHAVRLGEETDEPARLARLGELVSRDLVERLVAVADKVQWVELTATLTGPRVGRTGQPLPLSLSLERIEDDRGNDWAEDLELVLRPVGGGAEVRLPLAPGKCFSSAQASVVGKRPGACTVVTSTAPARLQVSWPRAEKGLWTVALAYRYSDDHHIKDTDRLPRLDTFSGGPLQVQ